MKLKTRLIFLFGALLAVFLTALLLLHRAQRRSALELQGTIAADKTRQLERIVALFGSTLERFAADYTQWDEMCAYVASGDPEWAAINLEQSLASWRFHGVWVIAPDHREIYRHLRPPLDESGLAGIPEPRLIEHVATGQPRHFFLPTAQGLLEIRTAPIRPSDERLLNEPPAGWLVVARLWDSALVTQLGVLTDSEAALLAPSASPVPSQRSGSVNAVCPLPGWNGEPARLLALRHHSELLDDMIAYDRGETVLFLCSSLAFLALSAWGVHRWVQRPLELIVTSLECDRPESVAPLQGKGDEIAHLADLVRTAAEQRSALAREVGERATAEAGLRRALAERAALGRDLHDGVIQSIYAIGMALQGVGTLVREAPAEAQRRIETCVDGLNRTIFQLRTHITGLEQEETSPTSLREGLERLLRDMQAARPLDYDLELDPALAAALPADSIAQLLFIAREALSNSVRHGLARRIRIRLASNSGEPALTIADDGLGFDPAAAGSRGHGLDNMTRRAEEIGASFSIESAAAHGTLLRIELPRAGTDPTSLPHP